MNADFAIINTFLHINPGAVFSLKHAVGQYPNSWEAKFSYPDGKEYVNWEHHPETAIHFLANVLREM